MKNEEQIEAAIITAGLMAPRITPTDIDEAIVGQQYWQPEGTTLTVCVLTLKNGTTVVGESACISAENFNADIGKNIAFTNAREKVWGLEGYLLKDKLTLGVERIARVAHEVNRAYCVATGDKSQEAWDKTPEWQQESALVGVKAHLSKELSPRESHEAWAAHKLADGWSWGLTKDADKKKHPCLVPYDSLPITQRVKDYLFTAVVKNMR